MKPDERREARALRAAGCSVRAIAQRLNGSRGTVSLWVRDIELTGEQVTRLEESSRFKSSYAARCAGARVNRLKAQQRQSVYHQAGYEKARMDERFRLICALYWGEGSKTGSDKFVVTNADPKLLRIILKWLIDAGQDEVIRFRVSYYPDNGLSEEQIRDWWLQQLSGLKPTHLAGFSRCTINRASQRKKIGKLPYGTATICVNRTELFCQVMGGIDYLIEMGA
jgi:hypothetical protein